MESNALDTNDPKIHKAVKPGMTELILKVCNIILLVLNAVLAFGIIGFYYGLYGAKPYQKTILISWVILILAAVVIKELKVKSLGKKVLLNIALYVAMAGNPYFYFFIW